MWKPKTNEISKTVEKIDKLRADIDKIINEIDASENLTKHPMPTTKHLRKQ
jgi:hypothetical protein